MNTAKKVILVKETMKELEKHLNDGWNITHVFQHAKGAIFILSK